PPPLQRPARRPVWGIGVLAVLAGITLTRIIAHTGAPMASPPTFYISSPAAQAPIELPAATPVQVAPNPPYSPYPYSYSYPTQPQLRTSPPYRPQIGQPNIPARSIYPTAPGPYQV